MAEENEQQLFEEEEAKAAEARRQEELELAELRERETDDTADYENSPTETWEQIRRANELAAQQTAYQEQQEPNITPLLNGPSLFKYATLLLMFAVPNDIIDALDLTGLGFLFSWFFSAFLSVTMLFVVWFTDSEFQRVKSHMANKNKYIKNLTRTATKVATRITKFAPKNPVVKIIAGTVLEMIPFISILPWSSISVFLAYADERKTYKEARETLESEGAGQLPETVPEMV